MPRMTAGEAVVKSLINEDVKYAFGIVGNETLEIADAFYDERNIKLITVRHEQGAACMASAYARISGQPGVTITTGGPGTPNIAGPLFTAFMGHVPVIALSGATSREQVYRDTGQELDHVAMFRTITKLALTIPTTSRIPEMMRHAFRVAVANKKGPVLVDFPVDMMHDKFVETELQPPSVYRVHQRLPGDPSLVRQAAALLKGAQRPLIIAGGGVTESGASADAVALAELLSAPLVTSYRRNDAVPNSHPLYVGPYGARGAAETSELSKKADVIIGVGTRLLGFANLVGNGTVNKDAKIIQIELDEKEIGRHCPVSVGIQGDAQAVLQGILEALRREGAEGGDPAWKREAQELRAKRRQRLDAEGRISGAMISPRRVYAEFRKVKTPDTIAILDAGACQAFGYDRIDFENQRTFISPPTGGLGYGIPEGVGAKLASPGSPVIVFNGDGGFLFNAQELETAVREHIPFVTLCMNNGLYGSEKALQIAGFKGRLVGTDITNPRFDKLAELYGGKGYYVDNINNLAETIRAAMKNDVPSVIEVPVDPDEFPRMGGG
ncbi:MAG: thiamine pyrophosphate-binding protein [Chloroflexi bacterium]|nr:thiamine pyrophosphate-binding protein [Chloroflexota bacterium]